MNRSFPPPCADQILGRWRAALAAVLLALAAFGTHAEQVVLASYQEAEGLTSLQPSCLVQDARAVLWICTVNGLFRFDGFRIRAEPLPSEASSYLYGAHLDPQGRLWVLAEGGVYVRQEGEAGPRWTAVLKPNGRHLHVLSGQQIQVDAHGVLYALDEDRLLWTAAVTTLPGDTVAVQRVAVPEHQYLPEQLPPLRLHRDALWFGCGPVLCEWRGGRLTRWGPSQGLPEDDWAHLLVARDGSLWARSGSRLARLAPGAVRFETVAAPRRHDPYGTDATVEDAAGAILTATDDGIARWDGRHWREWGKAEGLPGTAVRVLAFDAEGSLWLGAGARGVHRWVGYGQVEHWTSGSGLPSSMVIDAVRDGSGRLWAATSEGVAWFDEAARRFRAARRTGPVGAVYGLAVDAAGDLWWVERSRLLTVKAGGVEPRVVARERGLVIALQGAGQVYVSGDSGLDRIERSGQGVRRVSVGRGVFDPRYEQRVLVDGGRERLFGDGRNLWVERQGRWSALRDEKGEQVDGLVAEVTGDSLWAGGSMGLGRYALSEAGARLRQFLPKAAFGGATTAFLHAAPEGRLWMGTDQGLFIRSADGAWSRLDRRNGLVWNDLAPGFFADADGSMWVCTAAGLSHVLAGTAPAPLPPLRLDEVAFGSRTLLRPPSAPVAWRDRSLRVTLGTAGFSRARGLRVEYRLDADAPWRTAEGPVIDIGAVEPGAHVLELRAAGLAPVEGAGPVSRLAFEVAPPWWNSNAARIGYAVLLGLLWWASAWWMQRRARLRRLALEEAIAERTTELEASREALHRLGEHNARALEEERKRVARELHDELGQQLAALRMEVSVSKARVAANKPVDGAALDLVLGRVDRLVSTVRGLVSQLRPPALDGGLAAALEWLGAEFQASTGLPCAVHVDAQSRELPPELATMVFRVAQESLNNVRRHAQASAAAVSLERDDGQWVLEVRDDGVGFDPLQRRPGYGLLGMEERARLLGGRLEVHSTPRRGTRNVLRFATAGPVAEP